MKNSSVFRKLFEKRMRIDIYYIILGSFLFSVAVNLFIVPSNLYNGGFLGMSQVIRYILVRYMNINFGDFDISGLLYFLINIPILYIAYSKIGKRFFLKTIIAVFFTTTFLSVIWIPKVPLVNDVLSACIIGGIISGLGMGITLRSGGSGGGLDVIGIYYAKKYSNFSVGRISITFNLFVYGACVLLFNIPTVIYSVIYTTFASLICDKTHYQNIMVTIMIFTKVEGVDKLIIDQLNRGVTCWKGNGAYTYEGTNILVTVASKYEAVFIRKVVKEADPNAFIILNEGVSVIGNFEKRL
ncbi:YitT family protein [Clostridium sp.]|uniref:YitT family protein n=1 Tax=Clostridium sp. TaxID=1506 RepID=UPI002608540C|nr:YitT family protein [Clostridium sp.]